MFIWLSQVLWVLYIKEEENGASLELRKPVGVSTVGIQDQDRSGLLNGKDFKVGSFPASAWKFVQGQERVCCALKH